MHYFPGTGESLVLRMLDKPYYDETLVTNFVRKELMRAQEQQWPLMLETFRQKNGEANYRGIVVCLVWNSAGLGSQPSESDKQIKYVAERILSRCFPWLPPLAPGFVDATLFSDQRDLVEVLGPIQSLKIDEAVLRVFRRSTSLEQPSVLEKVKQFDLANACAERLIPKGYQLDFLPFFTKRLREFKDDRGDPSNSDFFALLDQRILECNKMLAQDKQK
jgi:hypothetical protein